MANIIRVASNEWDFDWGLLNRFNQQLAVLLWRHSERLLPRLIINVIIYCFFLILNFVKADQTLHNVCYSLGIRRLYYILKSYFRLVFCLIASREPLLRDEVKTTNVMKYNRSSQLGVDVLYYTKQIACHRATRRARNRAHQRHRCLHTVYPLIYSLMQVSAVQTNLRYNWEFKKTLKEICSLPVVVSSHSDSFRCTCWEIHLLT